MVHITNKMEHFSFKSGCVMDDVRRLARSVALMIVANYFVLLFKSLITNVVKSKSHLKA